MSKSKEKKKKFNWALPLTLVIYLIIGGICGAFMGKYMVSMDIEVDNKGEFIVHVVITLLALYVSVFVHIILHEGGHLVFGLMTGYKFSSFRIGSFMWIKKDDKIVLRRFSLAGTGGQCLMSPPDITNDTYPYFFYNMGGCFFDLIFAGIAVGISFLCGNIGMLVLILRVFAVVGVALAIMNGVPMGINDGSNILAISKSVNARKAFWLMMKINEQVALGVRIKDMPDEWFQMPDDEDMNNTMVSSTAVFKCNKLMDEMRFEEADKLMEELLNKKNIKINSIYRSLLKNDMIYCELIGENNAQRITKLLDKEQKTFMKAMKKFPSVLRTGYAYLLLAKKDEAEAEKVLELFDKMAKSYPNKVDIDSERELLECARAKKQEII